MELDRTGTRFHTTSWGQVAVLAAGDPQRRRTALSVLYERYWPPVYAHLRAHRHSAEEAAGLTQDFFEDVVLRRRLLERADRSRGRLRTYVLSALENYCRDRHRRRSARQASGHLPLAALHREEGRLARPGAEGNGQVFERRWALGLLEEALRRCESHFRGGGRDAHWALFEARVLVPALGSVAPVPLVELAGATGFASPEAAAAALQTVKRRALMLLREVVAETLSDLSDADDELERVRRYILG